MTILYCELVLILACCLRERPADVLTPVSVPGLQEPPGKGHPCFAFVIFVSAASLGILAFLLSGCLYFALPCNLSSLSFLLGLLSRASSWIPLQDGRGGEGRGSSLWYWQPLTSAITVNLFFPFNSGFSVAEIFVHLLILLVFHLKQYFKNLLFCFVLECLYYICPVYEGWVVGMGWCVAKVSKTPEFPSNSRGHQLKYIHVAMYCLL